MSWTNPMFSCELLHSIKNAAYISVFPHVSADPDALGSCYALKLLLEQMGKTVRIFIEQGECAPCREYLYLGLEAGSEPEQYDVAIALDCADLKRLGERARFFGEAKVTVNIDHHTGNALYAAHNAVDPDASATAELVYMLANALHLQITPEIAHNIYVGIASDTGGFRYPNTTPLTHRIAAELMEIGADGGEICNHLYSSKPVCQLLLQGLLINNLSLLCGGKVAVCTLTKEEIESVGATEEDAGELSYIPRNISGVEVSIYLRERGCGAASSVKASLRSKHSFDVAAIAAKFGGGGHVRAAGCDFDISIDEAKKLLVAEIEKALI